METVLSVIGASIATGGAVGSLLKWMIINPLRAEIKELRGGWEEVKRELKDIDSKRASLKERVHTLEADAAARLEKLNNIYYRLDELDSTQKNILKQLIELNLSVRKVG